MKQRPYERTMTRWYRHRMLRKLSVICRATVSGYWGQDGLREGRTGDQAPTWRTNSQRTDFIWGIPGKVCNERT